MNTKLIKVLGVAASVIGAVSAVVADWSAEKRRDALIDEKVSEKVFEATTKMKEEEES